MHIMNFMAHTLLRLHAGGFPEAIAAGGAIRDWLNGREGSVKDVDIFIQDQPMYLANLKEALVGYVHVKVVVPERIAQYMQFEGVVCVHEFTSPLHPAPVQVIVMNRKVEPMFTIMRHDFGICQIGFDGETIYTTPEYDTDQKNKTFTLVRCRDKRDYDRSMHRWARLKQRYPDWQLHIPDGNHPNDLALRH